MKPRALLLLSCSLGLAACSGGGGLSTASIFGGGSSAGASTAAAPAAPVSDPTSRAFYVGMVSARATKCGYNFDPAKVKANFMAAEAAQGAGGDMAKLEKAYGIAYNGVAKVAASEPNYCSDRKTAEIKEDLTKILAGDYTPTKRKVVEEDDGSLFSGFGSSDGESKGVDIKPSTANGF